MPALIGVLVLADGSVGKLLVWSQVLLSLQLPFAMWPLIRSVSDRRLMQDNAIGLPARLFAWLLFAVITGTNLPAGDGRGGLSGRRRAGFASFGEVKPDDAVDLFPRY